MTQGRRSAARLWLRDNVYHVVFAVSICALIALGLWWTVFIRGAVTRWHDFHLSTLRQSQRFLVLYYDREPGPPPFGKSGLDERFRIGACGKSDLWDRWVMPLTGWDGVCIRPDEAIVYGIERKYERQTVMVVGEGTLLFILVGITAFMLWRLYRSERRFLKELGRFVEVLTHRLKGPATGLGALLETMKMGKVKGEELGDLIDLGMVDLERQQQIVDNILMACREREEPWRLKIGEVALRPLVDDLLLRWKSLASSGIAVEVKVGENERVMADENALRIVLENIVDNAVKYARGGEAHVSVTSEREGGMTRLHVEDRGIGIKKEDLPRLFDPFWRGGRTRRGSGLGLYISRRIARAMGGDVAADSEGEGKGTRITIALPAVPN